MSIDWDGPGFRMLLDWLEGRLDADRAEWVAAQVARSDERILRTVDWLRGFLATARELPLEEPPPIVRQRLRQYFARWHRTRTMPGRQELPPAGLRAKAADGEPADLACTA